MGFFGIIGPHGRLMLGLDISCCPSLCLDCADKHEGHVSVLFPMTLSLTNPAVSICLKGKQISKQSIETVPSA